MNNEPVAWIKQNPETLEAELHFDKPAKYWATVVSNPDIPLYTHPVKEHFEDEPQAEELHEILQSNSHPVKEQLTDDELIEGAILPLSLVLRNPNATGGDLREAFLKSARQILWLANRKAQNG